MRMNGVSWSPTRRGALLLGLGLAAAMPAAAVMAAEKLTYGQTIDIDRPPAAVWAVIANVADMPAWIPPVRSSVPVSGEGNTIGARRELTFVNDSTSLIEIVVYDPAAMTYSYHILTSQLPLADYVATVRVEPEGSGSRVTWSSVFTRRDTSATPAAGADDAAAFGMLKGLYTAGLENLKAIATAP
jgi:mxaD protein